MARKWRKQQLATVLVKWAVQALRLRPFDAQLDLRVRVSVSDTNPKEMNHTCFLEDEDTGNVAAFSLDSPSPVLARRVNVEGATEGDAEVPILPTSENEFDDLKDMDEAFLREIDELANREDLAVIPTKFYTPRVTDEETANGKGSLRSARGA